LTGQAHAIVEARAHAAYDEIEAAYAGHVVSGHLRDGLELEDTSVALAARVAVLSTAPHAHLYEYGTETRYTHGGASRGKMPAFGTVTKAAVRNRAPMMQELADMLTAHDLDVNPAELA
jgi:hypothetical protein